MVGVKNVTMNEPFFQGHFPDNPGMPGVLQVEAMAQLGGFVALQVWNSANVFSFVSPRLAFQCFSTRPQLERFRVQGSGSRVWG